MGMKKFTKEYFSHDYNAQQDPKIINLLMSLGWEGYGLYWAIIEIMYNNSGHIDCDYKLLAYRLRVEESKIKDVIENYGLFIAKDNKITSKSVKVRLKKRKDLSIERSIAGSKKWIKSENDGEGVEMSKKNRSKRLSDARKRGTHTKEEWEEMKEFFRHTCVKCNGESNLNGVVKDHIIPLYKGGSERLDNIQPLCAKCNSSKGSESKDYRKNQCEALNLEMPAKWLQKACKRPLKKRKEKKRKEKNTTTTSFVQFEALFLTKWNELVARFPILPGLKNISKSRSDKLKIRFSEKIFPENLDKILQGIAESKFLRGEVPSEKHPGWKVTVDWLINNDKNYLKILEGNYKNKAESVW